MRTCFCRGIGRNESDKCIGICAGNYLTFGIKQTNSTPIGSYVSTHVVISSDIDRTCKKLSNKVRLSLMSVKSS